MPPQSGQSGDTVPFVGPDGSKYAIPKGEVDSVTKEGFLKPAGGTPSAPDTSFGGVAKNLAGGMAREGTLGAAGGAGIPESQNPVSDLFGGLFHTFADKPSTEEGIGGALTGGGPGGYRMIKGMLQGVYGSGKEAVQGTKGTMQSKTPEEVQANAERMAHGAGGIAGTLLTLGVGEDQAMKTAAKMERIKAGSYAAATKEIEQFRKTVKEPPSKTGRVIGEKTHAAITERTNMEWKGLTDALKAEPQDGLAIKKGLEPLARVDPVVKKWIDDNIRESASGGSVSVPDWGKVRELSKQLNQMLVDENVDRITKAEIPDAHTMLEQALRDSAERQGLKGQYERAYQMNRKLENIKFHTSWEFVPRKASRFWGLGGALFGLAQGGDLGSAFIGKMAGSDIGQLVTPRARYEVPKVSLRAEKGMWNEFGESSPKGTTKRLRKGGKIYHYEGEGPKITPKPPEAPPKSGGGGAASGGTPSGGGSKLSPSQARLAESQKPKGSLLKSGAGADKPYRPHYDVGPTRVFLDREAGPDMGARARGNKPSPPRASAAAASGEKGVGHSSGSAKGAAYENKVLQSVKAAHPDWPVSKMLKEAAEQVKRETGTK